MSKRGLPGEEGGRARWSNFPNEEVDGAGDLLPVLAERQLERIGCSWKLPQRQRYLWDHLVRQNVKVEGRDLVNREPTC
jgi:hypothetical protein